MEARIRSTYWLENNWHRLLVHAAGILPLFWIASDYFSSDFYSDRPLMLRAGTLGLAFLVASFACTPISILTGWTKATQIRRALGLYGVVYISIHLFFYAVLDNELDFTLIVRDIGERRSMLVGLAAFVLLLPLVATSTRGWQRRLGKRWRMLHRLVFLAVPLAVLHFLWLDRDFIDIPVRYAVMVGLLFAIRLPPFRRMAVQGRQWLKRRRSAGAKPAPIGDLGQLPREADQHDLS